MQRQQIHSYGCANLRCSNLLEQGAFELITIDSGCQPFMLLLCSLCAATLTGDTAKAPDADL